MKFKKAKITILGLGNVGYHLSKVFSKSDYNIHQIYSRSIDKAKDYVHSINAEIITEIDQLDYNADIFIFCLKDEVLPEMLQKTKFTNQLLLHTAGSIDMNIFEGKSENYGVFYPVQTFSRNRKLEFKDIPICIESCNSQVEKQIKKLAESISNKVVQVSSEQRKYIHLAAVFAGNYSNSMYSIAQEILEKHGIDFDILRPLVKETANKVSEFLPRDAQTGPAIRNDRKTIEMHLSLMKDEDKKKLYGLIADYIQKKK